MKKNKQRIIFLIIILIAINLIIIFINIKKVNITKKQILKKQDLNLPIISFNEMFYEEKNFFKAIKLADKIKPQNNIQAIIVPHHLLASEYTAQLIKKSSGKEIKTVVIIGPNHNNIGINKIATVKAKWQTAYGYLKTNNDLVDKLSKHLKTNNDLEVFQNEHSIGAITPFVKYYLKEAEILPIALNSYNNLKDVEEISNWLYENLNKNSLIIFSLDFSHYLPKQEADRHDEITRDLIKKRNVKKIIKLSNTKNVDSPASLAISMFLANKKDLKTKIIFHGNSFDFLNIKPIETTSYFGIIFYE